MGRHKNPNKGKVFGMALPKDIYDDIKKLAEIKTKEHGEEYTMSRIGRNVMTAWVKKQREKYDELG